MRAPGGSLSAVHKVLNRALWTGVVAVLVVAFLGAGLMLGPLQEMARAGDVVAGQATFNRGDFHGFVGQPLVRPGQMPPAVVSIPAIVHRPFGTEPARLRHRIFGLGLPAAGVGLSYGPFDDVGAINPPAGAGAADDGYRMAAIGSRPIEAAAARKPGWFRRKTAASGRSRSPGAERDDAFASRTCAKTCAPAPTSSR